MSCMAGEALQYEWLNSIKNLSKMKWAVGQGKYSNMSDWMLLKKSKRSIYQFNFLCLEAVSWGRYICVVSPLIIFYLLMTCGGNHAFCFIKI